MLVRQREGSIKGGRELMYRYKNSTIKNVIKAIATITVVILFFLIGFAGNWFLEGYAKELADKDLKDDMVLARNDGKEMPVEKTEEINRGAKREKLDPIQDKAILAKAAETPESQGETNESGSKNTEIKSKSKPDNAEKVEPKPKETPKQEKPTKKMEETKSEKKDVKPSNKETEKEIPVEVKEESAEKDKKHTVTDKELDILEKIVMAEAGVEPYEGKIAVVNVIFNRIRSSSYPNTIEGVVFQKGQFTPAGNGRIWKMEPSDSVKKAVQEALNGKKVVNDNVLFFLNPDIAKDQTIPKTRTYVKRIGTHSFYK